MSFEVEGMRQLKERLRRLESIGDRIGEKALIAGAEILQAEMERRSPKRTGALSKHIIISEVVKGNIDVGPEVKDYFYARFLEFGTKFMTAQPFIEPAFLAVKGKVQRAMADVIRKELRSL